MQEIICHIGFPKTGTTYLQKNIFPFIKNINYVESHNIKRQLHDLIEKDDSFYNESKIHAELNSRHYSNLSMLFSYEALAGHHIKTEFPNRSQIARRLKAAGVSKIIITIRNQTDVLESTYKQYIKSGGVLKLSKFFNLKNNPNPTFFIDFFNYEKIIALYSEIFGAENVKVLQFEKLFSKSDAFKKELASFLNIKHEDILSPKGVKVNKSLSNFSTKALRIINHFTYNTYRPSHLISKKFSSHNFYKVLIRIDRSKSKKKLIFPYRSEINSYFSDSNLSLKEEYHIDLHDNYFYGPKH